MFDKINESRERRAYKKYAKLNKKRKSKQKQLGIFNLFDDIRRKTGYVK